MHDGRIPLISVSESPPLLNPLLSLFLPPLLAIFISHLPILKLKLEDSHYAACCARS